MTQPQLFTALLITILMIISAAREVWWGRYAMGATLLAVPVAGWLSMLFGK